MISADVQAFIQYALQNNLIQPEDAIVIRNHCMDMLHLTEWNTPEATSAKPPIDEILHCLVDYACESGIIADTTASRDLFDTRLMGCITALPHEVITNFQRYYAEQPQIATDWYYRWNQAVNYVRAGRIAKDLKWTYSSEYGTLDITINRSKPEKDPKDIAAAQKQNSIAYPKCQLCPENAGFAGNAGHPARQNLRPIPLILQNERWQFQYSPYGYYHEHCIIFNESHTPMQINDVVFEKLFDVLDFLPHYFIGSNADLPIVGGSILSHEHFQGGNYVFAMAKAPIETAFSMPPYPNVYAGVVKWPMSVIRLKSTNRTELAMACADILKKWKHYSDKEANILAQTAGIPHNTITPIARMDGSYYECDLVLRNNRTTAERPLGIFHPNPTLHHIKKENIGLIEVMGLAVLPARLAKELEVLEDAMLQGADLDANPQTASHAAWAKSILRHYPDFSRENAAEILRHEVGTVFEQVLCDAGVFKRNDAGFAAWNRFLSILQKPSL